MKKRLLSAILTLCMILTMMPTMAFAEEENASKSWPAGAQGITVATDEYSAEGEGDNAVDTKNIEESKSIWYKIEGDTLTIGGKGAIPDYSNTSKLTKLLRFTKADWYYTKDKINHVVIEDGITKIGVLTIANMTHLESIEIKGSNVVLEKGAVNNYEGNKNADPKLTMKVKLSVYQQNQMEKKNWFEAASEDRKDEAPNPEILFKISDVDKIKAKYNYVLSLKVSEADSWDNETINKIANDYKEYEALPEIVKSELENSVGKQLKDLYDAAIATRGWPDGARGINIALDGFDGTNNRIGISDTFWYLLNDGTLKLGGKGDFPYTGYDSSSATNGNLGFTRASWYNDRASITTVEVAKDVTALDYLNLTNLYKCDDIYLRNPDITLKDGAVCGYAGDQNRKLTLHLYKSAYDKKSSTWLYYQRKD